MPKQKKSRSHRRSGSSSSSLDSPRESVQAMEIDSDWSIETSSSLLKSPELWETPDDSASSSGSSRILRKKRGCTVLASTSSSSSSDASSVSPARRGAIVPVPSYSSSEEDWNMTTVRVPSPAVVETSPASSGSSVNSRKRRACVALSPSSSSSEDASPVAPGRKRPCVILSSSSSEDERSDEPDLPFPCHKCARSFTSKRGRTLHLRKCGTRQNVVRGPTTAALLREVKKKEAEETFRHECQECGSKFKTSTGLLTHRSQHCRFQEQDSIKMKELTYQCDCGSLFSKKTGVICHQTFHCNSYSYTLL